MPLGASDLSSVNSAVPAHLPPAASTQASQPELVLIFTSKSDRPKVVSISFGSGPQFEISYKSRSLAIAVKVLKTLNYGCTNNVKRSFFLQKWLEVPYKLLGRTVVKKPTFYPPPFDGKTLVK